MAKTRVDFIEIVDSSDLRKKEKEATASVRRICPGCGPVKLYRTADGRFGFQVRLGIVAGQRKLLDEAYRAVMRVLGVRRGRHPGVKTVQTKLRLPEPLYLALKNEAARSKATVSTVVAQLARRGLQTAARKSA